MLSANCLYNSLAGMDVGVDLVKVAIVVRQRVMHLGQGQVRVRLNNFIGRPAHPLVLDGDLRHFDARSLNNWFAAAHAFFAHDVWMFDPVFHYSSRCHISTLLAYVGSFSFLLLPLALIHFIHRTLQLAIG